MIRRCRNVSPCFFTKKGIFIMLFHVFCKHFAISVSPIAHASLCFAKKVVILQKYSRKIDEKYTKLLHYRTY